MIYTFTLNPALDRFLVVDRLLDDDTTRVLKENHYAAGKGIDVSRVIRELGGHSIAMGLVGGYDGLQLEGLLINAGVPCNFTKISGETRTNIILNEKATGHQYVISASGPEIQAGEIGQIYQNILQIEGMDYMVLSGSLPRGVTPNLYGQLIMVGRKKGAFVFLDTDGEALKESLVYQPTAIKPNLFELSRLMGRDLRDEGEIAVACDEIHGRGIAYVLVSRGKDGILFSSKEKKIKVTPPPVEVESTVGAGDSTVAGFVMAHAKGRNLTDCVRLACASGTATARTQGTELCHLKDVEEILQQVRVTEW